MSVVLPVVDMHAQEVIMMIDTAIFSFLSWSQISSLHGRFKTFTAMEAV